MRSGILQELPEDSEVKVSFEGERFYRLQGKGADVQRKDFLCRKVKTWKKMDMGDRLNMDGRELVVSRKETVLEKGNVEFHYTLAGESYNKVAPQLNEDMVGLEISGCVEMSEGEQCQVVLDGELSQGEGFKYPYAPITGNFMYCMPQDKSHVYVKMGSGEEKEGKVSVCLRVNGESCEGTQTPSQRSFHTESSKGLELYPARNLFDAYEEGIPSSAYYYQFKIDTNWNF